MGAGFGLFLVDAGGTDFRRERPLEKTHCYTGISGLGVIGRLFIFERLVKICHQNHGHEGDLIAIILAG